MRNVKYIAHYEYSNEQGRRIAPAATNKIGYIIDALAEIGCSTEVVSACLTSRTGYFRGTREQLKNAVLIRLPAFKWGNILQKTAAQIWSNAALAAYLLFKLHKEDTVIVYHSLSIMRVISLVKSIKKFNLILEVEEIYNDVLCKGEKERKKEISFIAKADKYIFPTELLNKELNAENKPYVVVHGTYKAEPETGASFGDGRIHAVYAGTFDPRKGGAAAAAAAGGLLPEGYHMHILGFGNDADTAQIKKIIAQADAKSSARVTYDGLLSGAEYTEFMQKCSIGLSTQNPDADFNATSFPSKILSYMANGLRVVSIRIPAIESSAVGDCIYYYDKQTPEEIASAIMSVDPGDGFDSREKIRELDRSFCRELDEMMKKGE